MSEAFTPGRKIKFAEELKNIKDDESFISKTGLAVKKKRFKIPQKVNKKDR